MAAAARLNDPIGHSPTMSWLLKGLLIGAAIGVGAALILGTGGIAAVAMVGAGAAGGAGIMEFASTFSVVKKEVVGAITAAGSANVFINGVPAARAHEDFAACDKHPAPATIAQGSETVLINSLHAARVDDKTICSAVITKGSSNVFIGGPAYQTDEIHSEDLVPTWVHVSLGVVGIGSALILAPVAVVGVSLAAGLAGTAAGDYLGGKIFGEGSDGQKLMSFGVGSLAGILGARGALGWRKPPPLGEAHNAASFARYTAAMRTAETANPLIESLMANGKLPSNYLTKAQAILAGWKPGKALENSVPGGQIGGDVFHNTTGVLPAKPGRVWFEADVGLTGTMSRSNQPGTRLLYSDDGLLYVTTDHYKTVMHIGFWKQ